MGAKYPKYCLSLRRTFVVGKQCHVEGSAREWSIINAALCGVYKWNYIRPRFRLNDCRRCVYIRNQLDSCFDRLITVLCSLLPVSNVIPLIHFSC